MPIHNSGNKGKELTIGSSAAIRLLSNMDVSVAMRSEAVERVCEGSELEAASTGHHELPDLLSLDEVEFIMDELRNSSESQIAPPRSASTSSSSSSSSCSSTTSSSSSSSFSPSSSFAPSKKTSQKEEKSTEETEQIDPRRLEDEVAKGKSGEKPNLSYIALISLAIQSSPESKMVLGDIYSWVSNKFSYFKLVDRSWRNSIRHNLSLNECFVKAGRCENGKGNYWTIHRANVDDFRRGDFRRRRARIQVRKSTVQDQTHARPASNHSYQQSSCQFANYIPMTLTRVSEANIISMFGSQVLVNKKRKRSKKSSREVRSEDESSSYSYLESSTPITPSTSTSGHSPVHSHPSGGTMEDIYVLPTTTPCTLEFSSIPYAQQQQEFYQLVEPQQEKMFFTSNVLSDLNKPSIGDASQPLTASMWFS